MTEITTADELRHRLGRFGIFAGPPSRLGIDPAVLATRIEQAGFTSAWIGGGNPSPQALDALAAMLAATDRLVVATGIANIWAWEPAAIRAAASAMAQRFPGRFILGLGVSHHTRVEDLGHSYVRPFSKMVQFLNELDHPAAHGAGSHLPPVVLAALGPKMLHLSAERTLGAHPYFTPPVHTARARATLGAGPLLVPEIAGSLASGEAGLAAVRAYARHYLQLPNYVNNLRRLGYADADVAGDGSDGLLAAVTPHGTAALVSGASAHLDAGADHVVIQPLADGGTFAIDDLPALAEALSDLGKQAIPGQ
jgi:probable F420-dependent oxidoreductase